MNVEALFGPIQASNDNARVCLVCSGPVTGHAAKKYCGEACAFRAKYLLRNRSAEKKSALARAPEQKCEQCGNLFKGVPKDKTPLRFCSRGCAARNTKLANTAASTITKALKYGHGIKRDTYSVFRPLCARCGNRFTAKIKTARHCSAECRRLDNLAGMRSKAAANDNKNPVECKECGDRFERAYGDKRRTFCSLACSGRAFRRARRKMERARLKGSIVESVDPTNVFDRDRWRCQLCGIKTPRNKRGTYAPNAPELDHIIPLSRGGEHSYRNTQCACRACNAAKSDTPLGQMRLFG